MQTTVVGNYPKIPNRPRPARLRNAINKRDRGEVSDEELAQVYTDVTVEVIQEQIDAGIEIITDGQVRWDDDQTYVARSFGGVEIGGLQRYMDTNTYYREPEVTGEVRWQKPVLAADWEFAQKNSTRPVKAILPGPFSLAALSVDKHYGDAGKLSLAYADALRNEAEALVQSGCKHIQVNDPMIVKRKGDVGAFLSAITRLLDGLNAETGLYTWFGDCDGILPQLLGTPADVIGLDFVAGPGNWIALAAASFDKKLGFGAIDGRNTRMESATEISASLQRVTEFVPGDRVYLNPSCGLEYLPRETAFDKLKTMVEGARRAEGVPA
jgi:5-methyltetrahydropteroyltriglutamate--homocysteine methyltransferase